MSADQAALRALERGHLRWEQLHPQVRRRLARDFRGAQARFGIAPHVEHQQALQHGEKGPTCRSPKRGDAP